MKAKRFRFVGLVVLTVGLGTFFLRRGDSHQTPAVMTAAVPNGPPESESTRAKTTRTSGTPLIEASRLMYEVAEQDNDELPSSVQTVVDEVLKRDATLAEFYRIREKSLRTKDEKRRYHAMLADVRQIDAAKDALLDALTTDEELDQEEEVRRLLQMKYLTAAADWADNPNRQAVFDAIAEVVRTEIAPDLPREQRGSAMGDKVELYQHLLTGYPEQAHRLREETQGTSVAPILMLAENMLHQADEAAAEYH